MKRSCKYEFATAIKVHTSRKYDETSYNWTYFTQNYEKKLGKNETFVHGYSFKERQESILPAAFFPSFWEKSRLHQRPWGTSLTMSALLVFSLVDKGWRYSPAAFAQNKTGVILLAELGVSWLSVLDPFSAKTFPAFGLPVNPDSSIFHSPTDRQIYGRTHGRTYGRTYVRTDIWTDACTDGRMYGRTYGRT